MKEYSTRDIQNKLLEILIYFKDFCKEHNLTFVLAGGTCLGAIRHEGFIPWDDDVDVFMLRDDYERLQSLWEEYADTNKYECVRSNRKINIHHSATEIKDCHTTFINKHSADQDINQGLMIDVIPLDGVSDSHLCLFSQYFFSMLFCCFNFQRLPEHKSAAIYYLTKFALTVVPSKNLRYVIWKFSEKFFTNVPLRKAKHVASFVEGATIMKQHFPKEWFINPGVAVFEGVRMPIPSDYDDYLKISYGDYMSLPPEDEQVPRHDTLFIDLEKSYKEYRGIRYLTNSKENKE